MRDPLFEALLSADVERRREALHAEVQQDLAAIERYVELHGLFSDFVREHNGDSAEV